MAITAYQVAEVTGVAPLDNVMQLLQDFGFFRVVLPFILIFAIFYGVLIKSKVLGDDARAHNITAIIAIAAAFLVVAYTPVVDALALLIPQASFLLVIVLLILMLVAFVTPEWYNMVKKPTWWWIPALIFIFIFIGIVGGAVGENIPVLHQFTQFIIGQTPFASAEGGLAIDSNTMNTLIGLGIVIGIPLLVIALVMSGGGKRSKTKHSPITGETEHEEGG